jgi:hypothetical protein
MTVCIGAVVPHYLTAAARCGQTQFIATAAEQQGRGDSRCRVAIETQSGIHPMKDPIPTTQNQISASPAIQNSAGSDL